MVKWIGRIFYMIFVFFLVLVLGTGNGLVQQSYYDAEVLKKIQTPQEAVKNFSSLGNGYLKESPLSARKEGNDALSYKNIATKNETNTTMDFDILIYPLVVTQETKDGIDSEAGFFFVFLLSEGKNLVNDYGINTIGIMYSYKNASGEVKTLGEKVTGTPYFALNDSRPILTISNAEFRNDAENDAEDFTITGIQIYAYPSTGERYPLITLGQNNGIDGIYHDENFILKKSDLDVRELVLDKTSEQLIENGIYHEKANLKPYSAWYWYVGLIYFAFIIIIPCLLFFRKQIVSFVRNLIDERKRKKEVAKKISDLKNK